MKQLKERMLTVCAWFSEYYSTRIVSRPLASVEPAGEEIYGRNAPERETDLPFDCMKSC